MLRNFECARTFARPLTARCPPLLSQNGFEWPRPRTGALSGQCWVRSALLLDLFRLESIAGRRLRGLGDLDPLRSLRNVLVTTESRRSRIGSAASGDSFIHLHGGQSWSWSSVSFKFVPCTGATLRSRCEKPLTRTYGPPRHAMPAIFPEWRVRPGAPSPAG